MKFTWNDWPAVTVALVVTLPRTFPAPFAPSYSVRVSEGVPIGAEIPTVQERPPLTVVQPLAVAERLMI